MAVIKNLYTQQHEIKITQQNGEHKCSVQVGGVELAGMSRALTLDMAVNDAPVLTIDLANPKMVDVEMNCIVEFCHNGKTFRLIEVI